MIRLGLNIDHVATLRNARGGIHPCPARAALIAKTAGADGITVHLREDRRHIKDTDVYAIKEACSLPLNLEMAATQEMQHIALDIKPNAVCIVPERREELTTEGGLYLAKDPGRIKDLCISMKEAGIRVSLFLDPDPAQLDAAANIGADIVELHTGTYANTSGTEKQTELNRLANASRQLQQLHIECHAGHGLTFDNTPKICAELIDVKELNIGHFLIGESTFIGLEAAISKIRTVMTPPFYG